MRDYRPRVRPEPAFPIRLLALDIDGTLVDTDATLSDRTIAAVRAAVDAGVRVHLATGRMPSSAVVFANRLGLVDPVVGHQGAAVREMPSPSERVVVAGSPFRGRVGRLVWHRPLAPQVAAAAVRFCREHGLDPHLN